MMDDQNIIRRRRTARSAFSLAELMIAIVILGLGLLMVASMFPVGWLKARELAEFTTSQSIISVAETTVKQLSRVDGPADPLYTIGQGSSFAGDLLLTGTPFTDTLVHVLNVENLLADNEAIAVAEDPWKVEGLVDLRTSLPPVGRFQPDRMWYGETQVTFGERVYPPMPTGMVPGDPGWNGALATRRFAWSVLYRLPVPPTPTPVPPSPPAPPEPGIYAINEALASTREFAAYYVTLRRTQPTHRFAQQDHPGVDDAGGLLDFVTPANSVIVPQVSASDLKFPVAWLVPLDLIVSGAGIPATAEVMLNAGPDNISPMLPPGSQFVVSGTGSVYRVEQREILAAPTNLSDPLTRLTLDRPLEAVDNIPPPAPPTHFVWVYPPRVERDEGRPSFFGPSPVVSIDVRTLTMSP